MGISYSTTAPFNENQTKVASRLTEKYANERKLEFDKLNEPVLWAKSPEDAHMLVKMFKLDDTFKADFLSDLTAYDNIDGVDGDKRFVLVYQLFSTELHIRVRIKCLLGETEEAISLTDLFGTANWLEREVFDLFGINFKNHPNMRRIMMDERFTGHPLRKEYPIKQREPFANNVNFHLGGKPLQVDTHIKEGDK